LRRNPGFYFFDRFKDGSTRRLRAEHHNHAA
jgi:hypothetical protein